MKSPSKNEQMQAYTQAVKSGLYAKRSGLTGKYDNVRFYWEDEITRHYLHAPLEKLLRRSRERMRRIRILDLGCGSADGYELLMGLRHRDADLHEAEVTLLRPELLGAYKGIDLNSDLIEQARSIYGNEPKVTFEQGDFTQGLPLADDEPPYDLYFTSYGTCSHHNDDETLIQMLVDIVERVQHYCVIVCDWIGRYSYEWQILWTNDFAERKNMDYVVSYIYDEEERERRRDQLQHLQLRLMSRQEAEAIMAEVSRRTGVEVKALTFFDRSVFTGRHMDTGDYNPYGQPIRRAVNSLHEANVRTDLSDLLVDYVPREGFDFVNNYLERLQISWNTLIHYVQELLEAYDSQAGIFSREIPTLPLTYPPVLRNMAQRMKRVLEGVGWLDRGLPRENIIEPQLGYALRELVTGMQQGLGCSHGLVGVFEVEKSPDPEATGARQT